jgi:hydrogenase expression/formation protein HypC
MLPARWADMCLAIPGRVLSFVAGTEDQLAVVDVVGREQRINIGMLDAGSVRVGDHLLIHMGFAMSVVTEAEAQEALSMLEMLGDSPADDEPATTGWGNR